MSLSDKSQPFSLDSGESLTSYTEKDVKKFIKKLKDSIDINAECRCEWCSVGEGIIKRIDKLAGDKLTT